MKRSSFISVIFLLALIFAACENEQNKSSQPTVSGPTLFQELDSLQTGLNFQNDISYTKDFNVFAYRNYYNGGGVAIGDINNDGLADIYLTSNLGSNKLYLGKGDLKFEDITEAAGVGELDKWSTGVTLVDINNDNLLDIYVCNAGYSGDRDQKNSLFINLGDNKFENRAQEYKLDDGGYTTHASFFDYDRDGDLDVYILNNSFIPVNTLNYSNKRDLRAKDWPVADFLKGGGDKLMRNDGGSFTDVSEQAGIYGSLIGFGLGITVGDVNGDNWPDVYVSNDFFERDYLYINQKDGSFAEELEDRISHLSHSSMGADMADINNDGAPEIFVTDMLPDDEYRLKTTTTFDNINLRNLKVKNGFYNQFMHNTLQLNDGAGMFNEISFYAGVARSDWSWGALIFDADNDGFNDLFVSNGILHDVIDQDFIDFFANDVIQKMVLSGNKEAVDSIIAKMPSVPLKNKFFKNKDGLKFIDNGDAWGITKTSFSNGAAYGDLDNDGDLDLVINNVNAPVQLYRNDSKNNFIGFSLRYEGSNKMAFGSKVRVYANGQEFFREVFPARGFQSSVDRRVNIGVGEIEKIDSVRIDWPDGKSQMEEGLVINEYHEIIYNNKSLFNPVRGSETNPFFELEDSFITKHEEDEYVDFFYERNIPFQLSKEGPCLAAADINEDGVTDYYVGSAAGFDGSLYVSKGNQHVKVQQDYFAKFKAFEDTEAIFFDFDNDGDQDLLIGSGGNNVTYNKRAYRDRLYINYDGRFELEYNAIPPITKNTSVFAPHDFDGDGDLDLFMGARSVPGEYGLSPGSHIYVNNGGQFTDATQFLIPDLNLAGMITDAQWVDVLPDEGLELVLVGEWMAPKILSFDGSRFNIIETQLSKYPGLWQSVAYSDIDNDGDEDLLLGNIGENSYLQADSLNTLFLWINDFDDNGSIEKIITRRSEGKDRPVIVKRDLVDQLPGLKKLNLMHSAYATKGIADLFPADILKRSTIKKVSYLSSAIAINEGNGNFSIKKMNPEAQLSCINAMAIYDYNEDGYDDVVVAGNNHYLLPQFSMLDACRGKMFLNDQKGGFTFDQNSGLDLKGVVRELSLIDDKNTRLLIAMINDGEPIIYRF